MSSNPQRLFQQQLGYGNWRTFDSCLQRLRCTQDDDFSYIWGSDGIGEDSEEDTPIFASKFAVKPGCQHFLAMANEDGKLVVHNTKENTPRQGEHIHQNAIFDLAWLSDSFKLITVSGDHTARLIDVENDMVTEQIFVGHTRSVKTVAVREGDSSVFATGSRDGSIRVWDTRSATASSASMFINPDRTIKNSHCKTTPTSSSKRRAQSSLAVTAANSVTSLVFQDDTTLISCGSGDGLIKVWDLRKSFIYGTTAMREIAYSGITTRHGFSNLMIDKSRNRLYANCLDNTIYCYNVATYNPEPVMEYRGHQNSTFYIKAALSPDGRYILSGSSDQNAYIWNIDQRHPIMKLSGHTAEVTCVAWRQEGPLTVVTCSDDVRHKVWRIGSELLPDNWQIEGRGIAEPVTFTNTPSKSLKRLLETNENTPVQAKSSKMDKLKRALDTDDCPEAKRFNAGRRLFALHEGDEGASCSKDYDHELAVILEEEEVFKTPKGSAVHKRALERTPEEVFSPTTNLPNFVIDGSAPHLNFSPQKRMDKDWLTKMRVERCLIKEMQELAAVGPSSPKVPRLEEQSPRHRTPRRRNSRAASHGQSPILKFFRVTNSSILNNSQCSPKSSLVASTSSPMGTAE